MFQFFIAETDTNLATCQKRGGHTKILNIEILNIYAAQHIASVILSCGRSNGKPLVASSASLINNGVGRRRHYFLD